MAYWIHNSMRGRHGIPAYGFEPEIERGPEFPKNVFCSILSFGRARFDVPGTKTEFVEEMRALLPAAVLVEDPYTKGVPDFFAAPRGYVFSRVLMEKLQELEPGVHRFFPIRVKLRRTGEDMGEHFLLYLDSKPDIIDHDRTLYGQRAPATGAEAGQRVGFGFKQVRFRSRPNEDWDSPLINFKPGGTDGRHFWRGTVGDVKWHRVDHFPSGATDYSDPLDTNLFASDELQEFYETEKLSGWDAQQIIEKSPSWYFEQREKGVVF